MHVSCSSSHLDVPSLTLQVPFNPLSAAARGGTALSPSKLVSFSQTAAQPSAATSLSQIVSRMASLQRISNYGTVCALRRQRSSEAAVLSRRLGRGLTRTYSQPLHSKQLCNGVSSHTSLTNATATAASSKGDRATTSKERQQSSTQDSRDQPDKKSSRTRLSPLSDEVFISDKTTSNEDMTAKDDKDDDPSVTPTRKIKNLKEFMELGRNTKLSDCSNTSSPSKSPGKRCKSPGKGQCAQSESDNNSEYLPYSEQNDSVIPNCSSRPTNCLLPEKESAYQTEEFPPSGLTPTESPGKHTSSSSSIYQKTNSSKEGVRREGEGVDYITNTATAMTAKPGSASGHDVNGYDTVTSQCGGGGDNCIVMSASSSTNGSTCSSALCPAETASRRCFSESDAILGLFEGHEEDEALCVEVWENPVASSPLGEDYSPPSLLTKSSANTKDHDVAKMISPIDNSHKNNGTTHRAVLMPQANDASFKTCKNFSLTKDPRGSKSSSKNTTLGNTTGTGWTVTLGGSSTSTLVTKLPPPDKFGGGNPFLMIICVTLLLQHRNFILSQQLDHNDLAMHFDKMVRKHNVHSVLKQARHRYQHYCSLHTSGGRSNAHQTC